MASKRKLRKQLNGSIIMYDLASVPNGISMNQIIEFVQKRGVLVYDSRGEGAIKPDKPRLIELKTKVNVIKIKDVNGTKFRSKDLPG